MAVGKWLRTNGRTVFAGPDAVAGYVAGSGTVAGLWAWPDIRPEVADALAPATALGIASLTVCLASLALLSGLLDEAMTQAVDHAASGDDGVAEVVTAFRAVAVIGAILAIAGAAATGLTPESPSALLTALPAVVVALSVWSLGGLLLLLLISGDLVLAKARFLRLNVRAQDELRKKRASGE